MSEVHVLRYRIILLVLVAVFIGYSWFVYTSDSMSGRQRMSEQALMGEKLWREYNCQACHQFYGLGGYLGPDLTNTVEQPGKGPEYIKAMLNLGIQSMPKFSFTEEEKEQIVAYLTFINNTGYYPNRDAELKGSGWVELKYKKSKRDK